MHKRISAFLVPALSVLCLGLTGAFPASAQEGGVLRNPEVTHAVRFAISIPVRDMKKSGAPQYGLHLAEPVRYPKQELLKRAQGSTEDGALQLIGGPEVAANIGINILGVGNGFPNYHVPDAPPDVNAAIGDNASNQIVQWVNVSYAVFNKTTGAIIAGPIFGNKFWSGLGGTCAANNDGDPIIQYDKVNRQWIAAQNVFSGAFATCIAVSKTDDATGAYFQYQFNDTNGFPDYPKYGLFHNRVNNALFSSDNDFGPGGSGFIGTDVCAFQLDKLIVGDKTALRICFLDNSNGTLFDDSMVPADQDSAIPPPMGEDEVYMGSIDNTNPGSNIYVYHFHVDFAVPGNSTFSGENGTDPVAVTSYSLACGGFGACIPQKGVGDVLDSLGDRLMYRLAYRNFVPAIANATAQNQAHEVWLINHSVMAGSSVGVRWYEFTDFAESGKPGVAQQGTFAPDSNYRWMGSIAMDNVGDIALGYSESSSTMFPSIFYTGRVPTDPPGTMETEANITTGSGSQVDTADRWGDYTSMGVDVSDQCTMLYTAEYYMVTATFDWSTHFATLKFPTCH